MLLKKRHSRIAIIIGTKAELIKCAPVMLELQRQKQDYWFIHTGQHPLKNACKKFGIKEPDFILSKEPKKETKFWSRINRNSVVWLLSIIWKIKKLLKKLKPNYVVYHGDTMSTAAAAIASSKLLNLKKTWKNAHLEAGLRSGSLFEPFPEEISRKIADFFSDILFAVSKKSVKNLKRYEKRKSIIEVGNTIIDASLIAYEKAKKKHKKPKFDYALINLHRHENLQNKKRMKAIVEIIKTIKIKVLWPLHKNTEYYLKKYNLMKEINQKKNIQLAPLVEYPKFIYLLANCKYLVTDGGSIQEESLIFKKPCIILRKRTERQEGLGTGINFLTKLDINYGRRIIKAIEEGKVKIKKFKNPYEGKEASKRILGVLR